MVEMQDRGELAGEASTTFGIRHESRGLGKGVDTSDFPNSDKSRYFFERSMWRSMPPVPIASDRSAWLPLPDGPSPNSIA